VEAHRVETPFGPVDVRLYRLREGWLPVAMRGRDQLPAEPVIDDPLPQSEDAALQHLAQAIDAMNAARESRRARGGGAQEEHRPR
jgi:hypothetical protein